MKEKKKKEHQFIKLIRKSFPTSKNFPNSGGIFKRDSIMTQETLDTKYKNC